MQQNRIFLCPSGQFLVETKWEKITKKHQNGRHFGILAAILKILRPFFVSFSCGNVDLSHVLTFEQEKTKKLYQFMYLWLARQI